MSNVRDAVDSLVVGDTANFKKTIENELMQRAGDRINLHKVQYAQSMFDNQADEDYDDGVQEEDEFLSASEARQRAEIADQVDDILGD